MDKLLESIFYLSSNQQDIRKLKTILQKEENSLKNPTLIEELLQKLDSSKYSFAYSYILVAKILLPKTDLNLLFIQIQSFILNCNDQIRIAPQKFIQICNKYTQLCIESKQSLKAIKPLRIAIQKLRNDSETLTPIHSDFLQVCLLSKNYSIAKSILEEEIFEINSEQFNNSIKNFLLYYYYGGMIYTGLKDYKKAFSFFKIVITSPAGVLSAIMAESYKKFLLISLLVFGKIPPLPKYTSNVLQKYSKLSIPQYQEFVNIYGTYNTDNLHQFAQKNVEIFRKDKNFGLIKQCIQSLYKRNIQRFTQTYLTFSLQDIANSVGLPSAKEAEKQVFRMITNGEIYASINQKDGMVSFVQNPESYDTNKMSEYINNQIKKVMKLGTKLRLMDEKIQLSTEYLQKITLQERGNIPRWNTDFEDIETEKNFYSKFS